MKKLNKIVFIDDDEVTNEYHKFIAKKANVAREALFFTTAESALVYLNGIGSKYDFPDLIFIDINMPAMSGHEFIDKVSDLYYFNEDRTVMAYLTTTITNTDVSEYAKNGMKHFYFKTINAVKLCEIVKEIFGIDNTGKSALVMDHRNRRP